MAASSYDDSTRLLGMGLAFLLSWVYSFTCCFNRRLKNVHFAIVLFYHSIFGFLISGVIIILKSLITGDAIMIFNFTGTQYLFILCGCAFDWLSLSLQTRAFQLDSSAFLSLVGYSSIVYAFVLDFVINGETITLIELMGVLMILAVTISVSVIKLRQEMMTMKDQ